MGQTNATPPHQNEHETSASPISEAPSSTPPLTKHNDEHQNNTITIIGVHRTKSKQFDSPEELSAAKLIASKLIKPSPDAESVSLDDVLGCEDAKRQIVTDLIYPAINPDAKSTHGAPKGVLLHGLPGNGKTRLMKATATELNQLAANKPGEPHISEENRFEMIHVTASSLTSSLMGKGEKAATALFDVAGLMQPTIVIIDEVEGLMATRNQNQSEAMSRLKTALLDAWDGFNRKKTDNIYVIGATNCLELLDTAMKRRFGQMIYIPLPTKNERFALVKQMLADSMKEGLKLNCHKNGCDHCNLYAASIAVANQTERFSFDDLVELIKKIDKLPLVKHMSAHSHDYRSVQHFKKNEHPITNDDIQGVCQKTRPTSNEDDIKKYNHFLQSLPPCDPKSKQSTSKTKATQDDLRAAIKKCDEKRVRDLLIKQPSLVYCSLIGWDADVQNTPVYLAFDCGNDVILNTVLETHEQEKGPTETYHAAVPYVGLHLIVQIGVCETVVPNMLQLVSALNELQSLLKEAGLSSNEQSTPSDRNYEAKQLNSSFEHRSQLHLQRLCELQHRGADINWQGAYAYGRTTLHIKGFPALFIGYLLKHGADPNIKNNLGLTPLQELDQEITLHEEVIQKLDSEAIDSDSDSDSEMIQAMTRKNCVDKVQNGRRQKKMLEEQVQLHRERSNAS